MEAHILVGCGGSGIRTLLRTNALLAQDAQWRQQIRRRIYYMVFDTDQEDVERFERTVLEQLGGDRDLMPVVKSYVLSTHADKLQPLVRRCLEVPFEAGAAPEVRDRLREHWWHRGQDGTTQPFYAPRVSPLEAGAGQCPPVSYFLTWFSLSDIGREVDQLMKEMMGRVGGLQNAEHLNLMVVAGLAGGTGRGCWELIAFKIRQAFQSGNARMMTAPRALLFDSSVYPDVFRKHREQEVPMTVNALTGISQLSAWISNINGNGGSQFRYSLPDLRAHRTDSVNVLDADLRLDVNSGAPVDHAYVVFGSSPTTSLAESKQYFEMAGTATYAALTKSMIDRTAINSRYPYNGLATATFEVSEHDLRSYFEYEGCVRASRALQATEHSGQVDEWVSAFMDAAKLRLDLTATDHTQHKTDPSGNMLQRVNAALADLYKSDLAAYARALADDDVPQSKRLVSQLMTPREDRAAEALERARASFGDAFLIESATQKAEEILRITRSIGLVKLFLDKVLARMRQEVERLPSDGQFAVQAKDDPRRLTEALSGKSFIIAGRSFDDKEQRRLNEVVGQAILRVNYPSVRTGVAEIFQEFRNRLQVLVDRAAEMQEALIDVETGFIAARDDLLERLGSRDPFKSLFCPHERPEEGLPGLYELGRFYKRVLRPPIRAAELEAQLPQSQFKPSLAELFTDTLKQAEARSGRMSAAGRRALVAALSDQVRKSLLLDKPFAKDRFTIRGVVQRILEAWEERLGSERDPAVRIKLKDRFQEFFGVEPGAGDFDFGDGCDEFILHMCASLAETCRPYWKIASDVPTEHAVTVFAPVDLAALQATERLRELVRPGTNVDVVVERDVVSDAFDSSGNPFVLLAYSREGVGNIDDIASLQHWKENHKVSEWLQRCEDAGGESIFSTADDNKGIGYVSPLYVRNPTIRGLRWKPWLKSDVETSSQAELHRVADALAYALFTPTGTVRDELERTRWMMPMLRLDEGQRIRFVREAYDRYDRENKRPVPGTKCPWSAEDQAAVGLSRLFNAMLGKTDTSGIKRLDWTGCLARISAEADHFWNTFLPHLISGTDQEATLKDYLGWLDERWADAQKRQAEEDVVAWGQLVTRVKQRLAAKS